MDTVEERVDRGVAWLDANVSDWRNKVSINDFNIRSGCRCILGQVFADKVVDTGLGEDGFDYARDEYLSGWEAAWLGFDLDSADASLPYQDQWNGLQKEWERRLSIGV